MAPPPPGPPIPPSGYSPGAAALQGIAPTWGLPQQFPYRDGDLIPGGYHIEERRRPILPIFGGLLMLGSYAFCAGFAGSGLKNAEFGYIPFVGPFIAMAKVELPYKGDTTVASFIISGIGEVAGAAVLIYGLLSTERWVVQNKKKAATWTLAPSVGKSGGGLGVVGTF